MNIKLVKKIIAQMPANISILLRGPTGIGKSYIAQQLANDLSLPFIDVRGSTMDEAQVSGIPDFESSKETKVATFCLPSWYVRACREPVVLMLDELNRSTPSVMQSFFQIVLDRELGNNIEGETLALHPETRVIAAVNYGSEYDVNDMDPALLRRFWVVDLEVDVKNWIEFSKTQNVDPIILEFLEQNPEHFQVNYNNINPGTVCPTPASWSRFDETLKHFGIAFSDHTGKIYESNSNIESAFGVVYPLALGFVGIEAAIAIVEFVSRYQHNITADDIINGKVDKYKLENLNASEVLNLIAKLAEHAKTNDWTEEHADNIAEFIQLQSEEHVIHAWTEFSKSQNILNIQVIHKRIGQKVVELVRRAKGLE
jgi:hypothetical protein